MEAGAGASGRRAPYRRRLELLAGGAVEELLDDWAAEQSVEVGGGWERIYGKLRPGRSPWALLVFQARTGVTVAARLLEPAAESAADPGRAPELGRVLFLRCTDDPALPGLRPVLAALEDPRVVRWHPGNRCIVRGGRGPATRFVKVFAEEVDDQEEARARWDASASGVLSFAVAEPHGWDEETRSSWYGAVPGERLAARLPGPDGRDLVRRVGRALGELAVSPLEPCRRDDAAHQLARTSRALARANAAVPALGERLDRCLAVLAGAHDHLGDRAPVPVHGAAHLGQWLVDGGDRLGLVDFDRFACGDPEFDVATFLVELGAASGGAPTEAHRTALLGGFCEVAGRVDEERLAVYVVHKRLARVARAAAGLRPDGEERALRELEDVEAELAALVRSSA